MAIIGRGAPADIIIPLPQVSARHAEITHLGDDMFLLTDLGSSNGTFVADTRIQSAEIRLSDPVRLGSFKIDLAAYRDRILGDEGAAERAPDAPGGPAVIIGRESPAEIVVNLPQVSARHAELKHLHDDVYQLTDLGSSNGTYVNGRRIERAQVRASDTIRLGSQFVDLASMVALVPQTPALEPAQEPTAVVAPRKEVVAEEPTRPVQADSPPAQRERYRSFQSAVANPVMVRVAVTTAVLALLVAAGWGLFSLYAQPYCTQRQELVRRIAALERTHENRVAMLADRDQAKVLQGIHDLLAEPSELVSVQESVEALRARANWFNQLFFDPPIGDDWKDDVEQSLRGRYAELGSLYGTLVRRSIETVRSEANASQSFDGVCESARRFDARSRALADSVNALSGSLQSSDLTGFDELRQLNVSPFAANRQELEEAVALVGSKMVAALHADIEERLRVTRDAANAPAAVDASKSLVQWLKATRKSTAEVATVGIPGKDLEAVDREIERGAAQAHEIIRWVSEGISAQKRCSDRLGDAIEQAKFANVHLQTLERYARSEDIRRVRDLWSSAASLGRQAVRELNISPPGKVKPLCDRITQPTRDSACEVVDKIESHLRVVDSKYAEAVQQESTLLGSTARAGARAVDFLGKLAGQAVDRAAQSRMGREIGISVKMLILSHKMLYDMMNPDSDPISWAFKYQDDMMSLMDETDEVMRMEGPSITGKNTFIEDLVDMTYESSFDSN